MLIPKNLLVIFLLLFCFACSNSNKTTEEIQKDWLSYETNEYSIKYPRLWMLNQSGYLGTRFLIISKQISIRDFYQENVGLVVEELNDSTIDLENFVKHKVEVLNDSIPNLEFIENRLHERGDEKFHQIIYVLREGINKVTIQSYYFLKNDQAYILTFSGKTLEMGRYQPIGEGILNSFRIK